MLINPVADLVGTTGIAGEVGERSLVGDSAPLTV